MQPPRIVNVRGTSLPLDLLMFKEDSSRLPRGVVQTREQVKRAQHDAGWAGKREYFFAAAAAGWHLSMFAINLAFWGFEGQAPDRYWPDNPRSVFGTPCKGVPAGQNGGALPPDPTRPLLDTQRLPRPVVLLALATCRIRLQLRPGKYGNLEGTQRIGMEYLARLEGVQ